MCSVDAFLMKPLLDSSLFISGVNSSFRGSIAFSPGIEAKARYVGCGTLYQPHTFTVLKNPRFSGQERRPFRTAANPASHPRISNDDNHQPPSTTTTWRASSENNRPTAAIPPASPSGVRGCVPPPPIAFAFPQISRAQEFHGSRLPICLSPNSETTYS
jgi:hypothetical protein